MSQDVLRDVLRGSIHENVHHLRFEIEGEPFIHALFDDGKPAFFHEMSFPLNAGEWIAYMR